jgi:hypothetical protein
MEQLQNWLTSHFHQFSPLVMPEMTTKAAYLAAVVSSTMVSLLIPVSTEKRDTS